MFPLPLGEEVVDRLEIELFVDGEQVHIEDQQIVAHHHHFPAADGSSMEAIPSAGACNLHNTSSDGRTSRAVTSPPRATSAWSHEAPWATQRMKRSAPFPLGLE